ncbi:HNH endonuclease [Lacrimispora sp.]|uniref:HNH endonuclease n=1 Tax=Lacrimispora sp. TaxID=2719234 RepID=UPI0028A00039|nr:HNH endonuclease [Lacrimispora sp.]
MIKTIYSWEILDENTMVKYVDLTFVKYCSTGIPKQIRGNWGIEDFKDGDRKRIAFHIKDNLYSAIIQMRKQKTELLWKTDFLVALDISKNFSDENTSIIFEREDIDVYNVRKKHDEVSLDIEGDIVSCYLEGAKKVYYTTKYERKKECRDAAIKIHGIKCSICGFDFEAVYGRIGKGFIEIHHKRPLYSLEEEVEINPQTDLITVCSNCHKMLHRNKKNMMDLEKLREIVLANM